MDRYQRVSRSRAGRMLMPRLGLPRPPELRRYVPGQELLPGPAVIGAAPGGGVVGLPAVLAGLGAEVLSADDVVRAARGARSSAGTGGSGRDAVPAAPRPGALLFDATGITRSEDLVQAYRFLSPRVRGLVAGGRVLVFGLTPAMGAGPATLVAQRALEGLTRALGKEVGRGCTVQLVLLEPDAELRLSGPLRFLLSARSAYVSGQVIRIGTPVPGPDTVADPFRPHAGRVIAVTGPARGIGEAIARTLARDGGTVIGIDVPALASELDGVARAVGGSALPLDVTAPDAAARIARHARERHGRLDAVVHNAGITRDRKLANLREPDWRQVIAVNLSAPERITRALVDDGVLGAGGRVVVTSSVSGIAGNPGQTNYAASKAGLIGLVDALAGPLAGRGITINAVAPGFIETEMTARIPFAIREAGRRLNSMLQGGLPQDVAETVGWLVAPDAAGVTGGVIRVCGQALIGA